MAATPPPQHGHHHGDDDDYASRLNRRASSFRSSVAEADRRRRSMASPTDTIRRRRSRASPPSPNRRPRCGTRPSDDNSFMHGGADDHPPRRSRVSGGDEGDRRRRRARVSDDEREVLFAETNLNLFRVNPNFIEYEKACENIKKSMLGPECSKDEQMETSNEDETGFLTLKRILRSTVMASAYFEEAGLVKIEVKPGQEMELCATILECCCEERIYRRYFGLLAQRYCMMRKVYQENFEKCFMEQYSMAHQLETCKLCIVAKFFAHLLETDTLPWHVLACIRLTEEQASSARIFVKVLFQELLKRLGIQRLKEKLNNPDVQGFFGSVFPEDHPRNLRFAISFFTAIGLGVITEKLREKLPQPASSGSQSSSGYESGYESSSGSE